MSKLSRAERYHNFFHETPEGKDFIDALNTMIESEHEKAESIEDPSTSHAHTQRAKGIRTVLTKISSLTTEAKKAKN